MGPNVIMLGPPGAGKGTQAERFAIRLGIPKISTGDILRRSVEDGTEIGGRVKAIMDRGELVNDELISGIVRERLDEADARRGFILDGFPRTVAQAETLDGMMVGRGSLLVIDIVVPETELVRRLASRMICADCGANAGDAVDSGFALADTNVPSGRCRRCGGPLVQRADDSTGVVRERLKVYHCQTEPLVEYYCGRPTFRRVNGAQPPDHVALDLATAVESAHRVTMATRGGVSQ
jgi:adenylate kinase